MGQPVLDLFLDSGELLEHLASVDRADRRAAAGEQIVRMLIEHPAFLATAQRFVGGDDAGAYTALENAGLALLRKLRREPLRCESARDLVAYLNEVIRKRALRIHCREKREPQQLDRAHAEARPDPRSDAGVRAIESRDELQHFKDFIRRRVRRRDHAQALTEVLDACMALGIALNEYGAKTTLADVLRRCRITVSRQCDRLKALARDYDTYYYGPKRAA